MPARWTIDHSARFVEIVAEGETDSSDFARLLEALEAANAVTYKKLLDVSRATGQMHGRDMSPFAARVSQYRNPGPFAVVVAPSGPLDGLARLFVLLAEAQGRGRVFRVASEARQWLATLEIPPVSP